MVSVADGTNDDALLVRPPLLADVRTSHHPVWAWLTVETREAIPFARSSAPKQTGARPETEWKGVFVAQGPYGKLGHSRRGEAQTSSEARRHAPATHPSPGCHAL